MALVPTQGGSQLVVCKRRRELTLVVYGGGREGGKWRCLPPLGKFLGAGILGLSGCLVIYNNVDLGYWTWRKLRGKLSELEALEMEVEAVKRIDEEVFYRTLALIEKHCGKKKAVVVKEKLAVIFPPLQPPSVTPTPTTTPTPRRPPYLPVLFRSLRTTVRGPPIRKIVEEELLLAHSAGRWRFQVW